MHTFASGFNTSFCKTGIRSPNVKFRFASGMCRNFRQITFYRAWSNIIRGTGNLEIPWSNCAATKRASFMAGSVANLALFLRIWVCFFVELRGFLKTCRLLVFELVLFESC